MPESKISYQLVNNNALTGFQINAPSLQRLYIDSGLAFIDTRVKLEWLKETDKRTLTLSSNSREDLLKDWLGQIEALFGKTSFLPRRIVFDFFDGKTIQATLWGEMHDSKRHGTPINYALSDSCIQIGQTCEKGAEFFARVTFKTIQKITA